MPPRPVPPRHVPHPTGKVRIIGGHLRGSRLEVPDRPGLRPTPDRVRETLFNWLMAHVGGARCLDLYAGTGALGIEALSRGAREVVFAERDPGLAAALRANLARLGQASVQVIAGEALAALDAQAAPFDIVFLDPPFADDLWAAAAQRLETRGLLRTAAHVYVEMPLEAHPALPAEWHLHREGKAGQVRHLLYRRDAGIR